jgi:hypothetical protein
MACMVLEAVPTTVRGDNGNGRREVGLSDDFGPGPRPMRVLVLVLWKVMCVCLAGDDRRAVLCS